MDGLLGSYIHVRGAVKKGEKAEQGKPAGGDMSQYDLKKMVPQTAQLTDRFGNTFHFGNAGDYWHPPMPIGGDSDYRSHVHKVSQMEIRPDDVILCSFPKTGSHWTMEMITMLMNKNSEHVGEQEHTKRFIDLARPENVAKLPSPRFLVTHIPFRHLPKAIFEKKVKVVLLERNPKDVLVSYYNHLHSHVPPLSYPGTFEQFYRLYFECGFYYGDIFDYLMEWQRGLDAHPDFKVYKSVFEDVKLDPIAGVKRLNEYLGTGCSEELCVEIAAACSFKNLKSYKDAHVPDFLKKMFKDQQASLYRKGTVGDWKNWFTVAMNEHFESEYKKRMSDYKFQYTYTLELSNL